MRHTGLGMTLLLLGSAAWGSVSQVIAHAPSWSEVRDDAGNWGGDPKGITHQCGPGYWSRKVLDLSNVSPEAWQATTEVRVSLYFCVYDYSWHSLPQANGLDEAFALVVNGVEHRYTTNSGVPTHGDGRLIDESMRWHDFILPKSDLVRGPNDVIVHMVLPEGKKVPDDYLYLGIDNSVETRNSWVRFAEGGWRQDILTVPGGTGEYMVRVLLIHGPMDVRVSWQPAENRLDDAEGLADYAGDCGASRRLEWNPLKLDRFSPITVSVDTAGEEEVALHWLNDKGEPFDPPINAKGPHHETVLSPPWPFVPTGVVFDRSASVRSVELRAKRTCHETPPSVDMVPHIEAPRGAPVSRAAACRIEGNRVLFENSLLHGQFENQEGRLCLTSLFNEVTASEMVRHPEESALFLVEANGRRYAGSRDFRIVSLEAKPESAGFRTVLACDAADLEAVLDATIADGLVMGVELVNRGAAPLDFKLAFPYLSGLAVSDEPAADYYFFPWGGGIFSDAPAMIRRGYGNHEALYQLMDVFSPSRGGGLSVRCLDEDGRFKVLALRKHVPGVPEKNGDAAFTQTPDEYKWGKSLPAVPGSGMAFEYLRRTRAPGESFAAKPVAIEAHAGDWHTPMQAYAAWCHTVWPYRRMPSALTPVLNMLSPGWAEDVLFRDGAYRMDVVKPHCDSVELMSWWEWSKLGPWRTPWDKLEEKLGTTEYARYKPYFVKDPVTGELMYTLNRGDYDGYNARWGGLPALRDAIAAYRTKGALPTLYTDPLLADDNTQCGQKWGELWGLVQADGRHSTGYESWNMCHDVAEYRSFVADTMRRVIQETDADGIRLDEYGHAGPACFNGKHSHTFAEHGCTEWLRAIAEATRMVRQAMDEVKPRAVLMVEHPGYDYLLQFIEGTITYDLSVQATPLRPLECNIQRFYFPECKAYELDLGADPKHLRRFWNGVASFGACYPENMDIILRENADAFGSTECKPLVPGETPRVYVNRFGPEGKRVCTLCNATGHTFAGPAVAVPLRDGDHVFDLLNGCEADSSPRGDAAVVRAALARNAVGCVVRMKALLHVERTGDTVEITVAEPAENHRVALCDANGRHLADAPVTEGKARFDLANLPTGDNGSTQVKLMEDGRLTDACVLPQ